MTIPQPPNPPFPQIQTTLINVGANLFDADAKTQVSVERPEVWFPIPNEGTPNFPTLRMTYQPGWLTSAQQVELIQQAIPAQREKLYFPKAGAYTVFASGEGLAAVEPLQMARLSAEDRSLVDALLKPARSTKPFTFSRTLNTPGAVQLVPFTTILYAKALELTSADIGGGLSLIRWEQDPTLAGSLGTAMAGGDRIIFEGQRLPLSTLNAIVAVTPPIPILISTLYW